MNKPGDCTAALRSPLKIIPVTFRTACTFVAELHRHNKPPAGHKFSVGLQAGDKLVGVAMAGRPVARHFDDGLTLEVNRTCTDGTPNANSMLYGAIWRAAKAMGYYRCITYTQADETGASLRAAGWVRVKELPARKSWAESTGNQELRSKRDPIGNGGVARVLWEIRANGHKSAAQSDAGVKITPDLFGTFMAQPAPDDYGTALQVSEKSGGGGRNRTGVRGFAVRPDKKVP